MYDSHGRIVYDYGDTPGMQRPVSGNSNALGSQSLDDRKNGKDYFSGNMFAEISFLKDFKFTFRAGIENDNTRQWYSKMVNTDSLLHKTVLQLIIALAI